LSTKLIRNTSDINSELARLGVPAEVLKDAALAWLNGASKFGSLVPAQVPGIAAWGEAVGTLRELLCQRGWVSSESRGGLATVTNPENNISIGVVRGDENTGLSGNAMSLRRRGPATVAVVEQNIEQLSLFAGKDFGVRPAVKDGTTWVLLLHRTESELRYELSLPTKIGQDGRIVDFKVRLQFDAIPLHTPVIVDPMADAPTVDITILRKASE
jgi:hypothetical protein